jgi:hypothetical protein
MPHPGPRRQQEVRRFLDGGVSFVPGLLPQEAVATPLSDVLEILRGRYGRVIDDSLAPERIAGDTPERGPEWILESNLVGINIRTVGDFSGVIKYSLTLPAAQNAIHLLPFWEPGVVGSLYGMSSWEINPEFFSSEWASVCPGLDTPFKQLTALVNLLRATGRRVGLDVIPHTDRFSEIVLSNPGHFEWLRRRDKRIVDHRENLHEQVQDIVNAFLRRENAGAGKLFSGDYDEAARNRLLFGPPEDFEGRKRRRARLAEAVYTEGYEPVPATMGPPYRGLRVDPKTAYRDAGGYTWRDYRITDPGPMSRVFGPLTRYKLYRRIDNNREWQIDFSRPRKEVWRYVCHHYGELQRRLGFDFMRGDMSHVQMRPKGVPAKTDDYYDLLGAVKRHVVEENGVSHFAYFAETFMAPPDVMAYGNEIDHLEAAGAEATLGDLQSVPMGSDAFLQRLRWYLDVGATRNVVPAFTIMTGDKDDPRFDEFYLLGNEVRYFIALFLPDIPSYMALNFEVRDPHPRPAPNEHYTKLYVFQESDGPKATRGPFCFGGNALLYEAVCRIRLFHEELQRRRGSPAPRPGAPAGETAPRARARWLLPPDATAGQRYLAWTLDPGPVKWVFLAHTGTKGGSGAFRVPLGSGSVTGDQPLPRLEFSTYDRPSGKASSGVSLVTEGMLSYLCVENLGPGEGRVYRLES